MVHRVMTSRESQLPGNDTPCVDVTCQLPGNDTPCVDVTGVSAAR